MHVCSATLLEQRRDLFSVLEKNPGSGEAVISSVVGKTVEEKVTVHEFTNPLLGLLLTGCPRKYLV